MFTFCKNLLIFNTFSFHTKTFVKFYIKKLYPCYILIDFMLLMFFQLNKTYFPGTIYKVPFTYKQNNGNQNDDELSQPDLSDRTFIYNVESE